MANPANDLLEKAAVLGLALPVGAMVGGNAASLGKPNSYEAEKEYRTKVRGKNYGAPDKEDKLEEIRRSMKPSEGGTNKIAAENKAMKKGGSVKEPTMTYQTYTETGKPAKMKTVKMAKGGSASARADGCAVRGKTRA